MPCTQISSRRHSPSTYSITLMDWEKYFKTGFNNSISLPEDPSQNTNPGHLENWEPVTTKELSTLLGKRKVEITWPRLGSC